jgi:hypothetical protein
MRLFATKPATAMVGQQTIRDDMETITISGRIRHSLWLKLNPIWWFFNDDEQQLEGAPWYRPEWPEWRRKLYWYVFRNPLQNFRAYVLGVQDKNYMVLGKAPVRTVQRDDLSPPEHGLQYALLYGGDLWLPRFFISYAGRRLVFQLGWQPSGFFGLKLNLHGKE